MRKDFSLTVGSLAAPPELWQSARVSRPEVPRHPQWAMGDSAGIQPAGDAPS